MTKRRHNFTDAQKMRIHDWHDWTCAACGHDWPNLMEADHWISGNPDDEGVTLCYNCNRVKGATYIPELYRLPPREPLAETNRHEWKAQIDANQAAWLEYVKRFRGHMRKYVDGRKWPHFVSPF